MQGDDLLVFVGPSLPDADLQAVMTTAASHCRNLTLRPPVRRHDLLDTLNTNPGAQVLILDGEFGQSLSISITEIRHALASGLRLTGAASMGALRAVECRTLGMRGSGWVHQQYLTGAIESDAEVALLYDPDDYSHVTIPLINIRWLVTQLVATSSLDLTEADSALRAAASVHFRDRRASVLRRRWQELVDPAAMNVLAESLEHERPFPWDRKRLDALAAVDELLSGSAPAPDEVTHLPRGHQ